MKKDNAPSLFTKLYWLTNDGPVNAEVFSYFSELFWPKFVKRHGLVFLEQEYSEARYDQLHIDKTGNIEFWINLFLVSDFFEKSTNQKEESIQLTNKLVECWGAKLKLDFPDLEFVVQTLSDDEETEYGLTFYQSKNRSYDSEAIPFPNIKESCLEGLKPGKPTIRQPRPDETPHN